MSVSDLHGISSRVSTTEHCFEREVIVVNFDHVQASDVGVLTVLEIWRHTFAQVQERDVHSEIFFGKIEGEVLLELELNLSLENRRGCWRQDLESIFVDILHFHDRVVLNRDIVNDDFDSPGLAKGCSLVERLGQANQVGGV